MRSYRLFHSARRLQQHVNIDFGVKLGGKLPVVSEKIDDALHFIITSKDDSSRVVDEALKADDKLGLLNALKAFQLLRNTDVQNASLLDNHFVKLNSLAKAGLLDTNEKYLSAAALHWHNRNYSRAGQLLETILLDNPNNVLAMRLAQDCYILGGLRTDALGCLIRHPIAKYASRQMDVSVSAMLAIGYIEQNRIADALEISEKAIALCKSQDTLAMHALLLCFQFMGHSSEVLNYLSKCESQHSGCGLVLLLGTKGVSHILRGNYLGAFKAIQNMTDALVVTFHDTPHNIPPVYLSEIIFLLWNTFIQTGIHKIHMDSFHNVLKFLFTQDLFSRGDSELSDISSAMLLSLTQFMVQSGYYTSESVMTANKYKQERLLNPSLVEKDKETEEKPSYFSKLLDNFNANVKSSMSTPESEAKEEAISNYNAVLDVQPFEITDEMLSVVKDKQYVNLARRAAAASKQSTVESYSELASIQPKLNFIPQSSFHGNQKQSYAEAFTTALLAYSTGEYNKALELWNEHHFDRVFCGTAAQRDLLVQTKIELYMCNQDWHTAKLLLQERSILIPSDGQTWRRLSVVYHALGDDVQSEHASYTSYTLGLGQGGFGGGSGYDVLEH